MRSCWLLAIPTLAACASAPRVEYRPAPQARLEDAPGDVDGQPAASYPIPDGEVRVAASPGRARELHARLIVHNGSREVWTLDVGAQKATVNAGVALGTPVADDETLLAVLMPGDTRTLDLRYQLPDGIHDAAAVATFRLAWRVTTPTRVIAAHDTPFERHELPPPPKVPADPKQMARKLLQASDDDGLPRPGRAEATGWSSWRD